MQLQCIDTTGTKWNETKQANYNYIILCIYVVSFSLCSVERQYAWNFLYWHRTYTNVYTFSSVPNHWAHSFYSNYDHIHTNIEFIVVITIITITVWALKEKVGEKKKRSVIKRLIFFFFATYIRVRKICTFGI